MNWQDDLKLAIEKCDIEQLKKFTLTQLTTPLAQDGTKALGYAAWKGNITVIRLLRIIIITIIGVFG